MGLLRDGREGVAALLQRRRRPSAPARVLAEELGLERLPERGVLLQFSSPGSMPSRIALNRLAAAVARCPGEALAIEHTMFGADRLAARLGVRSTPTILYVTGEGEVLLRWTRPPGLSELEAALAAPAVAVPG